MIRVKKRSLHRIKEEEDLKKFMEEDNKDDEGGYAKNMTKNKNKIDDNGLVGKDGDFEFIKKFNEIEKVKSVRVKGKKSKKLAEIGNEGDLDGDLDDDMDIEDYADKVMEKEYKKYDKDVDEDEDFNLGDDEDVDDIDMDEQDDDLMEEMEDEEFSDEN